MAQFSRVPLRRQRRRLVLSGRSLLAAGGGLLAFAALLGYLVFSAVRDAVAAWSITQPVPPIGRGTVITPGSVPTGAADVGGHLPRKWAGTDRVTVLLLGIDRRPGEKEKGYLTDSMMLVTVDPLARTAAILSLPRDLWVEVPGYGMDTLNTANRTGDYYDYPGGGSALARKTVEYNLGVTINYYARLDFVAFETLIDTIGGIEVEVEQTIDDPLYPDGNYGYEPFYLPAGKQHLNGHDALRYARTRHDSSDIARARRQQQVVMATRDKVLSLNMLPTLIAQAPHLYQTLNASVQTDLRLDQLISLALLAQDIPRESIRTAVIDYRYVLEETTPAGRQVLVPLRDKIRELRDSLFTSPSVVALPTFENASAELAAEGARVLVLNGAGVPGLAQATAEWLIAQRVNVVAVDTADRSDYALTAIVAYTAKPYTTRWLAAKFHVGNVISGADPNSTVDIKVILGADWKVPAGP